MLGQSDRMRQPTVVALDERRLGERELAKQSIFKAQPSTEVVASSRGGTGSLELQGIAMTLRAQVGG